METSTPSESEPVQFAAAAKRWMLLLVAGVAIAAASAIYDRGNRKNLEKVSEITAVGDKSYYPIKSQPLPVVQFGNTLLVVATKDPLPFLETDMVIAGTSDDQKFRLYFPVERAVPKEHITGSSWYVKVAPGQFVRLTR